MNDTKIMNAFAEIAGLSQEEALSQMPLARLANCRVTGNLRPSYDGSQEELLTMVAASLMNFLVFWFTSRNHMHMNPKQIHRRQEFKRDIKRNTSITRHKCAICDRTELDCPEMQFRFCSKCDGNYEYCEEHLYTHTHVKKN